jgi:tripartite-type tricarboxylate transporter receptor subunit TctC
MKNLVPAATRIVLAAALTIVMAVVHAQDFPSKPMRWIVPFPAGGPADILSRLVADRFSENVGQRVLIDNRVGASGIIGTEIAVKAPPDGYTLVWGIASTITINQFLNRMNYDPAKDLAPVSLVNRGHFLLIVRAGFPASGFQEFVELARSRTQRLTYGSWGPGSGTHLAMALLERRLKSDLTHVPYKGTAPVLNDLLGGHLDVAFETTNPAIHHIRAGKLRAIGVSAPARKDFLPDVPAIAEVFPGFEVATWGAFLAPATTPKPILAKLSQEIARVVKTPAINARMADLGTEPVGSTPEELAQRIRQDVALWSKVIQELGLKPE